MEEVKKNLSRIFGQSMIIFIVLLNDVKLYEKDQKEPTKNFLLI